MRLLTGPALQKRGWTQTASSFAADAGINEADWHGPPIEAPQGLLYEWWAVFWDVFVARSQRATNRNAHADTYVEAVRAKREPLTINFAGPHAPAPITMPRSLPINSQGPALNIPGPRVMHTHPGQLHVLEQQQLQQQMQAGRPPIALARPGNGAGSFAPGPSSMHMQHLGGQLQPGQPNATPFPGQGPLHPAGPGSAQSSPRVQPAPHPLANGRGPPIMVAPGQSPGNRIPPNVHEVLPGSSGQGPLAPAFAQSMAALGLSGRDPESLTIDEQMRRVGALPPLPPGQHPMRAPPARILPQRMPSDSMLPQSARFQGGGASSQQALQQQQREPFALQQRMQQQGPVPPQMQYASSQMWSPTSPAYSAPSPFTTPHAQHINLSAAPANQGSPSGTFAPPQPPPAQQQQPQHPQQPPSRAGNKNRAAANQMSPVAQSPASSKRGQGAAHSEEAGPRSRKRARGATAKEEEHEGSMGPPETPVFDGQTSSSPAMGLGTQSHSAMNYGSSQDQSARGAMDAMQISHTQRVAHQHQQQGVSSQPGDGSGYHMQMNGDMIHGPTSNGVPNGRISRPNSASSNFLQMPTHNGHNGQPAYSPNGTGPRQLAGSPHLSLQIPSGVPPGSSPVNVSPGGTVRPFAGASQTPLQAGQVVPSTPMGGGGGRSPVNAAIAPLPLPSNGPMQSGEQPAFRQSRETGGVEQQQQQYQAQPPSLGGSGQSHSNPTKSSTTNGNTADNSSRPAPPPPFAPPQSNGMPEDMYADLSLDFEFDDFVNDGLFPDDPSQVGDGST
ncbi:hypothetical protein OIV83_002950 [Microbotryomycetes sp. JL201]|nr:hypothetical protein OIV83_002950 [Microbotryomycetes sp. JL201]